MGMDSYPMPSNFPPHPSEFLQFLMRRKEPLLRWPKFPNSRQENSFWDYSILLTMWEIWSLGAPEEWHKTVTATSFSGIWRTLWPTSVSQNRPKVSVSCWRLYTATPGVYMRRINCDSATVNISFFIYFAKNHEIGSLVVRKVEKSWESRQNRTVSLDQFGSRRAVADLLVVFIAWTSQKDLFCLKVDRSANLNLSKSTWRQLIVQWNVQNQNLTSKALGREIKRNSCDPRQATS